MKHAVVAAALLLSSIPANASRIRDNVPKGQISRIVAEFLRGDARGKTVGIACDTKRCAIYTEQENWK